VKASPLLTVLRMKRGMTPAELAAACGVSARRVARLAGEGRGAPAVLQAALARELAAPVWDLFPVGEETRLRRARRATGLSVEELAKRAGLRSYGELGKIDRGERQPSIDVAQRLAAALETSPAALFGEPSPCECGCDTRTYTRFARGHNKRTPSARDEAAECARWRRVRAARAEVEGRSPRRGYRYATPLLNARRLELGLSIAELARRCDVGRPRLSEIAKGTRRAAAAEQRALAEALGIPPESLFQPEPVEKLRRAAVAAYERNPAHSLRVVAAEAGVSSATVLRWLREEEKRSRTQREALLIANKRADVRLKRAAAKLGQPRPDVAEAMREEFRVGGPRARALKGTSPKPWRGAAVRRWEGSWKLNEVRNPSKKGERAALEAGRAAIKLVHAAEILNRREVIEQLMRELVDGQAVELANGWKRKTTDPSYRKAYATITRRLRRARKLMPHAAELRELLGEATSVKILTDVAPGSSRM